MQKHILPIIGVLSLTLLPHPAMAHVGAGGTGSFAAGLAHPFGGLDHIAVMIAVGLWAALKGGRALWIWPLVFVGTMLAGAALGMAQITMPFVEPAILASVVAIGLLVALAVDLPVWTGAAIVALFALFHGHAHGSEIPENASGLHYLAGFATATMALHLLGLGLAVACLRNRRPAVIRIAGAACVATGVILAVGVW
jgi:urease accessory protein